MEAITFHPASFRDKDGRMFTYNQTLYRGLSESYRVHYERLKDSGLLAKWQKAGDLVKHEEIAASEVENAPFSIILRPALIPFISYPYEWSFSQYKDAALLTLQLQMQALEKGMVLKDASAYNVQFLDGKPVFIDIASFEIYETGSPWQAYGQFCRHFLAPLLLMAKCDIDTHKFMQSFIDGIPLHLASKLLPKSTWFSPFILMHIHLHSKSQKRYENAAKGQQANQVKMPLNNLKGMIDSMIQFIKKLSWQPEGVWKNYYEQEQNNYQDAAFLAKKTIINAWIDMLQPQSVWDLGGNTGIFSRIASQKGLFTLCFDIDPAAVELNYQQIKKDKEKHLLPLVMDLTQPSPAIGWANEERQSLAERGKPELVMALALIHHLSISNNLPFTHTAKWFAELSPYLLIEFVPKSDSQVQKLLATRKDIFDDYNQEIFENIYSQYFSLKHKKAIPNSERTLYLWEKRK